MTNIKPLIPKDYFRIACSELRHSKAEAYWSPQRRMLIIKVDDTLVLGPFNNSNQLESIHHVMRDVVEMKGNYGGC